ncbi:SIMPL domain-containing protein [Sinimarinibacterium thermocellulolyticum]|uniref:SIMPL domain-containing protein n=1 Tax=Sinimarinibacterium thermocellulolyticum TaxID=3170016 RepID=A0ABV2ACL6_9GAMM
MKNFVRGLSVALAAWCCATASAAQPLSEPPTIAVSGHGEVTTLPDRARLSLAVDALDGEVKAAEAEVNRIVRRYLETLGSIGVDDRDISTTGISLQPEYVWDEAARQQKLVGYRARRDIQVLVRKLDRLGDVILGATEAGVNHVHPPMLESSEADALVREALVRAAKDAQARAQALAGALGVKLGSARVVREAGQALPPPQPYKMMAMRAEAALDAGGNPQMGINAGEIRIAADVSVEFDLIGR